MRAQLGEEMAEGGERGEVEHARASVAHYLAYLPAVTRLIAVNRALAAT